MTTKKHPEQQKLALDDQTAVQLREHLHCGRLTLAFIKDYHEQMQQALRFLYATKASAKVVAEQRTRVRMARNILEEAS